MRPSQVAVAVAAGVVEASARRPRRRRRAGTTEGRPPGGPWAPSPPSVVRRSTSLVGNVTEPQHNGGMATTWAGNGGWRPAVLRVLEGGRRARHPDLACRHRSPCCASTASSPPAGRRPSAPPPCACARAAGSSWISAASASVDRPGLAALVALLVQAKLKARTRRVGRAAPLRWSTSSTVRASIACSPSSRPRPAGRGVSMSDRHGTRPRRDPRPGRRRQPAARPALRGRRAMGDQPRWAGARPHGHAPPERRRVGGLGRLGRRRAAARSTHDGVHLLPLALDGGRVRGLLRGLRQRGAVAALPRRHPALDVRSGLVGHLRQGERALRPGRGPRAPRPARWCGCTTTSSSWCRPCSASCGPTCGSASSSTSRSRPHELFSRLPWREQILEGLLGADVIGFQRRAAVENFAAAGSRSCSTSPATRRS